MEIADWEDCPWPASELEVFYDNVYEPIKPPAPPIQPQQQQNSQTPLSTTTPPTLTMLDCASEPMQALPSRCSTIGLYQEVDLLQHVNAAILIAPPTPF
jgi:hypothetical protein